MNKLPIILIIIAVFSVLIHSVSQDFLMPVTLMTGASEAVPWASSAFHNWVQSAPSGTGFSGGVLVGSNPGVVNVGTIAFHGYTGPRTFICKPLVKGVKTYVTSHFGEYRTPQYNHSGIDYGTNGKQGLPVITPIGGKVVYIGIYGGWGYSVLIENDGYQVLLSHASDVYVSVGDVVSAGDVVMASGGKMGDERDGNSTGPHLHFEVRKCVTQKDGEVKCVAVDPSSVLLPGQDVYCDWIKK